MATSKLSVANNALQLLGQKAVVREEDLPNTPAGAVIYSQYDDIVRDKMRQYAWSWLIQSADLEQARAVSPYNGAWAVYTAPNNMLRLVTVLLKYSANRAAQYRLDADGIHSTTGGYLTAVFMRAKPESDWTPEFTQLIQSALALAAAGTVKADYVVALTEKVQRQYEIARTTDIKASRGNEVQAFDCNGIIRAIGGGGSHRYEVFGGQDYYGARGIYIPN